MALSGQELVERFKVMDTCCVSDAADRLGIPVGLYHIKPVVKGVSICGQVKGTVGDFLDDVQPGQVVVIDNGGRDYCTVWGDLMSISASTRGIAGTIIDGVCRDLPTIYKLNYPIYTKGAYMVTGKDRVEVDAVNVPVAVSGIQVKPGDIILADDTGAIAIPLEAAEEVLKVSEEIAQKEAKIEAAVREGKSLKEARASVHYHNLQTHVKG